MRGQTGRSPVFANWDLGHIPSVPGVLVKTRLGGTCRRGRIIRPSIGLKELTFIAQRGNGERPVCPRVFPPGTTS